MTEQPHDPAYNVVPMPAKPADIRDPVRDFSGVATAPAVAGSPDDPRMKEAMRLMQAFLAIEDELARTAMITLAESLVSFAWVRKANQR
jgi:hypothetical protein